MHIAQDSVSCLRLQRRFEVQLGAATDTRTYLISDVVPPSRYRMTTYHKQTSGRWARDDPAFVLIMAVIMATAACAYCVAFGGSVGHSIYTIVSAVAIDFIGVGVGISTLAWYISNTYLRTQTHSHTVDQKVEW